MMLKVVSRQSLVVEKSILKTFIFILSLVFSALLYAQYADEEDEDSEYQEQDLPYVEIKSVSNFADLTREAKQSGKVILLEMSASYCGYCKTLEEHIIKPMLRSGDYTQRVLIRKLDVDSYYPMNDLSGKKSTPSQLASSMGVFVTPTLLFLDGDGNEVSERIIGVNTLEFYGGYVDDALKQGYQKINTQH